MNTRAEIVKMVEALERVAGLINSDTPKEIRDAILAAKYVVWGSLNDYDASVRIAVSSCYDESVRIAVSSCMRRTR